MIALLTTRPVGWTAPDIQVFASVSDIPDGLHLGGLIYNSVLVSDPLVDVLRLCGFKEQGVSLVMIEDAASESQLTLKPIFKSIGGFIYDDLDALFDPDVLRFLVSDASSELVEVENTELSVVDNYVSTFLQAVEAKDPERLSMLKQSNTLFQFCNATQSLKATYEVALQTHDEFAAYMVSLLSRVEERVRSWGETKERQDDQIADLQDALEEFKKKHSVKSSTNTVMFFPTYSVPLVLKTRILYVKEYSYCAYLFSMLDCYARYLASRGRAKRVRVGFLVVHHVFDLVQERYAHLPTLTATTVSMSMNSILTNSTFATCEPSKEVLDGFLQGCDIAIVLDRVYRSTALLSGKKLVMFNAMGTLSDIARYTKLHGLNMSSIIQNIGVGGVLSNSLCIPSIQNYLNMDALTRQLNYKTQSINLYTYFDQLLDLGSVL